jgi:hypothetical protein
MDIKAIKKYLPESGHFDTEMDDLTLATFVDSIFFKEFTPKIFANEEEQVRNYVLKKEVAYQVIKKLLKGHDRVPALIQSEEDWRRYFCLDGLDHREVSEVPYTHNDYKQDCHPDNHIHLER